MGEQRTGRLERAEFFLFLERSTIGTDLVSRFGSGGTIGVLQRVQIACERLVEIIKLAEDMVWVRCSFFSFSECNEKDCGGEMTSSMDAFYTVSG